MPKLTVAQLIKELQESPNLQAEVRVGAGTNLAGTAATNDLITVTGHGLAAGDRVRLLQAAGGTGLTVGNSYYVIAAGLTANDFAVSATEGGSAVDITVAYTGVTLVKQSISTVTDPAAPAATFPPDAPGAPAAVPGVTTLG